MAVNENLLPIVIVWGFGVTAIELKTMPVPESAIVCVEPLLKAT